jgi:hypothetical protein
MFPILPTNRLLVGSEPVKGKIASAEAFGIQYYQGESGRDWQQIVEAAPICRAKKLIIQPTEIVFTHPDNDHQFAETLFQVPHHTSVNLILVATQTDVATDVSVQTDVQTATESREMNWLRNHAGEIERYRGEWILIVDDHLIAHSRRFQDIRTAVDRDRLSSPFVYYVPAAEESEFILL